MFDRWLTWAPLAFLLCAGPALAQLPPMIDPVPHGRFDTSDTALLKTLPGFSSEFATVNGIRLHYVIGG